MRLGRLPAGGSEQQGVRHRLTFLAAKPPVTSGAGAAPQASASEASWPVRASPLRSLAFPAVAAAVLVPIKAFAEAKVRLAPALDAGARADLARRLAARVLAAGAPLPVAVVCDDDAVAAFAEAHGATVIRTERLGLNGAVAAGVAHLADAGFDEVVVAHGDLPLAAGLADLAGAGPSTVTLVPDRRDDGTNVLVVPTGAGFGFHYGARSFAAHRVEAERLGLDVRVVRDERLAWDVDLPDDLEALTCD